MIQRSPSANAARHWAILADCEQTTSDLTGVMLMKTLMFLFGASFMVTTEPQELRQVLKTVL